MVIFHSYVKLPEGIWCPSTLHRSAWNLRSDMLWQCFLASGRHPSLAVPGGNLSCLEHILRNTAKKRGRGGRVLDIVWWYLECYDIVWCSTVVLHYGPLMFSLCCTRQSRVEPTNVAWIHLHLWSDLYRVGPNHSASPTWKQTPVVRQSRIWIIKI